LSLIIAEEFTAFYNGLMQPEVIQQLLDLNSQFYQSFGKAFAATRRKIQPGVAKLLKELPQQGDWLDLGCGSGAVAAAWAETPGRQGCYLGVDFSPVLLQEAREAAAAATGATAEIHFLQGDLGGMDWWHQIESQSFDVISAFAVLHHIPGTALREQILEQVHRHLLPGGVFVFSVWQLQNSLRLMARLQPWSRVGLSEEQVETGDVLMDWRYTLPGEPERVGLRYVHLFNQEELIGLASGCQFDLVQDFESDGKGGTLGLYQVWKNPQ
jgi:tRNA (uracil-5-)-methyltransferase TRM9